MIFYITATTDGKFLGHVFENVFPILLGTGMFSPDTAPIPLGENAWRFFNSNYSIDCKEI